MTISDLGLDVIGTITILSIILIRWRMKRSWMVMRAAFWTIRNFGPRGSWSHNREMESYDTIVMYDPRQKRNAPDYAKIKVMEEKIFGKAEIMTYEEFSKHRFHKGENE